MKLIETLEKYIIYLIVFLVPLVFLPIFPNMVDTPKFLLLVAGVSLLCFLYFLRALLEGKLKFATSDLDLPVIFLMIAYLVSALFMTPNKMEAFFVPGTATLVLASGLFYFLVNQKQGAKKNIVYSLIVSFVLLSLATLASFTDLWKLIPQLPEVLKQKTFTLVGGYLPTLIVLASGLALTIGIWVTETKIVKKILLSIGLPIIVAGVVVSAYSLLPGKLEPVRLPDFQTSWVVAIDSLKESPLLGVGPGSYLTAFNRFRPLSYNLTDLWAFRFTTARNFFLTAAAETGFLGIFALALFVLAAVRKRPDPNKLFAKDEINANGSYLSFAAVLVFLFLFPANTLAVFLMFLFASFSSYTKEVEFSSKVPAVAVSLLAIGSLVYLSFWVEKVTSAELIYKRAITAVSKNDAQGSYDLMREAINTNPYVDRYRISFAQLNLSIAQNIARDTDLTEEERNTVTQLISQAINEGKAAVSLNSQRSTNWEILARIYQTIMSLAQGADRFAIDTFAQAIAFDPINPELRLALGGIHYASGNFDDAIDAFKLATLAKPDLANAHYNLAIAYREKGEVERAITEMKIVLNLVPQGSNDYNLAKADLEALETEKPTGASQGESIQPPPEAPKPAIEPPIELPEESPPSGTN